MAEEHKFAPCCLTSFEWDGKPLGREKEVAGLPTYVTGDNKEKAVLYVHDALGWEFKNARVLADHYAREVDCSQLLRILVTTGAGAECLNRIYTLRRETSQSMTGKHSTWNMVLTISPGQRHSLPPRLFRRRNPRHSRRPCWPLG